MSNQEGSVNEPLLTGVEGATGAGTSGAGDGTGAALTGFGEARKMIND